MDAWDNNPEKANESIEKMIAGTEEQFPEMVELEERNKVAREKFEADKKVASKELGAAQTKQVDLMKYSWSGSKDYKGNLILLGNMKGRYEYH